MIYDITLTVVDSATSTTHAGAAVSIEVVQVVGQVNAGYGGAVTSVAGRTGDVTLTKTDVGLANVDNTADTAKPVSTLQAAADTATQAAAEATAANALSTHAGAADPHPNYALETNVTTALAGKAESSHTHASTDVNTSITTEAGTSISLSDTHHGKIVRLTSGTAVAVTVPNSLRADFSCLVIQDGAGQATFTGSSATVRNRQSHTKTAGQYAPVTIFKVDSGEFRIAGDTAS